jgi:hypothetical protein
VCLCVQRECALSGPDQQQVLFHGITSATRQSRERDDH